MAESLVTVLLPCLDEAASLPDVLGAVPPEYAVLVIDNNSTDGTAEVARGLGAHVVTELQAGYGAAVHAGVSAARTPIVAVLDADGSLDPADLPRLVAELRDDVDLVVGRRRPVPGLRWPWHARLGNMLVCWWLRFRYRLPVHDIAPLRVGRRQALLALGVTDRRSGYPVELLVRAARARWRIVERDVAYGPRTGGKSKVTGSLTGSAIAALDFLRAAS
ncbi:MAG: glycosyltransferase family 2 protein [Mycobacterium sp.]|nr:glycosyltransferase family 2 protein [Mycobacterium sp.]